MGCFLTVSELADWGLGQVAAPTITSVSPASGSAGTYVTIIGTNLNGATAVALGGAPAASFVVNGPTQVTAVVPANGATGPVTVTTPGGLATAPAPFTFSVPAPTISSITPTQGASGTAVTITGSNLSSATGVTFNGTPASSFTVVGPGQLTAVAPASATTGPVVVTGPGGMALSTTNFTFGVVSTLPAYLIVQQAVDSVLQPAGLSASDPASYTLGNLTAMMNAAIARGVDPTQVVQLLRAEVYSSRLESEDPNPSGDVNDLAARLAARASTAVAAPAPAPFAPAPAYTAPIAAQPSPFAPPLAQPSPFAPPASTDVTAAVAASPRGRRGFGRSQPASTPDAAPAAAADAADADLRPMRGRGGQGTQSSFIPGVSNTVLVGGAFALLAVAILASNRS